ncbi:hypothetical protein G0Q06_01515 [Puniceicoccales bacterium CK1056]|uniref:Immunoglobulin domain-containing protein n=1 Tax=Oceanipulchritudo coccoides TaxID=2706888 RepID=A0A6B2LX76_9BACT|nr:PHB depolymerase family esterase [Oceanipulchritudo coccoides]NDV61121.1 hypothetical protein [Oceanipulchritudo coccoides]
MNTLNAIETIDTKRPGFAAAQYSLPYSLMLLINRLIFAIGVFFIALTESFALPVIAFHPQDTSVELGGTATLFIRYPRTTTPSIQWQFNGIEIPGATSRDLIISEAGFSDVGTYRAVLTDGDGSITSEGAILNILGPIDPPFDPGLRLEFLDGTVTGSWTGEGILEAATTVSGPWETVGAADPGVVLPWPDTSVFYRLQNPHPRPTRVFIPTSYDPEVSMPLLIGLHGYTGSPTGITNYFGINALAESRGFLYCAPPGIQEASEDQDTFWNATTACCNFYDSQVDDVAYLTSLISEICEQYNVDPKRIHIIGQSNGGFMAYRMASERASMIASIASLAGVTEWDPSLHVPTEPVHILQIHGTEDELITYGGGLVKDPTGAIPVAQLQHPGAVGTIEIWAAYNGCEGQETETNASLDLDLTIPGLDTKVTRYATNPPGGTVELWTIEGGRHSPTFASGGSWSQFPEKTVDWLLAHPKP